MHPQAPSCCSETVQPQVSTATAAATVPKATRVLHLGCTVECHKEENSSSSSGSLEVALAVLDDIDSTVAAETGITRLRAAPAPATPSHHQKKQSSYSRDHHHHQSPHHDSSSPSLISQKELIHLHLYSSNDEEAFTPCPPQQRQPTSGSHPPSSCSSSSHTTTTLLGSTPPLDGCFQPQRGRSSSVSSSQEEGGYPQHPKEVVGNALLASKSRLTSLSTMLEHLFAPHGQRSTCNSHADLTTTCTSTIATTIVFSCLNLSSLLRFLSGPHEGKEEVVYDDDLSFTSTPPGDEEELQALQILIADAYMSVATTASDVCDDYNTTIPPEVIIQDVSSTLLQHSHSQGPVGFQITSTFYVDLVPLCTQIGIYPSATTSSPSPSSAGLDQSLSPNLLHSSATTAAPFLDQQGEEEPLLPSSAIDIVTGDHSPITNNNDDVQEEEEELSQVQRAELCAKLASFASSSVGKERLTAAKIRALNLPVAVATSAQRRVRLTK